MTRRILEVVLVLAGAAVMTLWMTGYGRRPARPTWNEVYQAGLQALERNELPRARELLFQALELARTDAERMETQDDLGQVHYRMGDLEGAIKWQTLAVETARRALGAEHATVKLYQSRLDLARGQLPK